MRIISGTAGSIVLKVPATVTRPTTDRVREAVFSMVGEFVAGARVLDLFAGSGAMGLEALSRGATGATFVEQHSGACETIKDNLTRAKLRGGQVTKGDSFATLRRLSDSGERFNLIFADPPYAKKPGDSDYAGTLLESAHLRNLLEPGGMFVLETMVTKHDSGVIAGWDVIRDRAYGSSRILILQLPSSAHAEKLRAADLQSAPAIGPGGDGARSVE
jgi:16S rRNA (guanine966-N2)-methyltransferase